MMKMYDELMDKPHEKSVVAMVAEPDYQYGAEAFEAYEEAKGAPEIIRESNSIELKKDGKSL